MVYDVSPLPEGENFVDVFIVYGESKNSLERVIDDRVKIETLEVNHPGSCVAYKFTQKEDGKKFVFSTDFEPGNSVYDGRLMEFIEDADLWIADGQYEHRNSKETVNPFMVGWGHSDPVTDLSMAIDLKLKKLINSTNLTTKKYY